MQENRARRVDAVHGKTITMNKSDMAYYEAIEAASEAKLDNMQLLEILHVALAFRSKGNLTEAARLYERVIHILMSYQEAARNLQKADKGLPGEVIAGIEDYADLLAAMGREERLAFVREKLQTWREGSGDSHLVQLKLQI